MKKEIVSIMAILLVIPMVVSADLETVTPFPSQIYGGENVFGNFSFDAEVKTEAIVFFNFISPYGLTPDLQEIVYVFTYDNSELTDCSYFNTSKIYVVSCEKETPIGVHYITLNVTLAPNIKPGEYSFGIGLFPEKEITESEVWVWKTRDVTKKVNVTHNVTQNITIEVPAEPVCGNGICETGENETCVDCQAIVVTEDFQDEIDESKKIIYGLLYGIAFFVTLLTILVLKMVQMRGREKDDSITEVLE